MNRARRHDRTVTVSRGRLRGSLSQRPITVSGLASLTVKLPQSTLMNYGSTTPPGRQPPGPARPGPDSEAHCTVTRRRAESEAAAARLGRRRFAEFQVETSLSSKFIENLNV